MTASRTPNEQPQSGAPISSAGDTDTSPGKPAITPRHPDFDFGDDIPVVWHPAGPMVTHFFNGLSLTFPEGERFFVDAVKFYKPKIDDPQLLKDIRGFSGQEAIHSNEHVDYNKWLARKGLKPEPIEKLAKTGPGFLMRKLPQSSQLAITCAIEHYTALLAEQILSDPEIIGDCPSPMKEVWHWHALEEAEHKAVAFDVFKSQYPGLRGYVQRCLAITITTIDLWLAVTAAQIYLTARSGHLFSPRAWWQNFMYQWIKPGLWRKMLTGALVYYKPGFHPNDRDTDQLTAKWRRWYADAIG